MPDGLAAGMKTGMEFAMRTRQLDIQQQAYNQERDKIGEQRKQLKIGMYNEMLPRMQNILRFQKHPKLQRALIDKFFNTYEEAGTQFDRPGLTAIFGDEKLGGSLQPLLEAITQDPALAGAMVEYGPQAFSSGETMLEFARNMSTAVAQRKKMGAEVGATAFEMTKDFRLDVDKINREYDKRNLAVEYLKGFQGQLKDALAETAHIKDRKKRGAIIQRKIGPMFQISVARAFLQFNDSPRITEGEMRLLMEATDLYDRFRRGIKSIFTGEVVTPKQIMGIFAQVPVFERSIQKQWRGRVSPIYFQARQQGLNMKGIFGREIPALEEWAARGGGEALSAPMTPQQRARAQRLQERNRVKLQAVIKDLEKKVPRGQRGRQKTELGQPPTRPESAAGISSRQRSRLIDAGIRAMRAGKFEAGVRGSRSGKQMLEQKLGGPIPDDMLEEIRRGAGRGTR